MSNIEEDIMSEEAFNELIDNFEIVNTLTEYGRKAIKQNVKKLQKRIKELESKNRIYVLNGNNVKLELYIKENYIPKQKVKDKIEEYKTERNKYEIETQEIFANNYYHRKTLELTHRIYALEDLLKNRYKTFI